MKLDYIYINYKILLLNITKHTLKTMSLNTGNEIQSMNISSMHKSCFENVQMYLLNILIGSEILFDRILRMHLRFILKE